MLLCFRFEPRRDPVRNVHIRKLVKFREVDTRLAVGVGHRGDAGSRNFDSRWT